MAHLRVRAEFPWLDLESALLAGESIYIEAEGFSVEAIGLRIGAAPIRVESEAFGSGSGAFWVEAKPI